MILKLFLIFEKKKVALKKWTWGNFFFFSKIVKRSKKIKKKPKKIKKKEIKKTKKNRGEWLWF